MGVPYTLCVLKDSSSSMANTVDVIRFKACQELHIVTRPCHCRHVRSLLGG